MTAARYWRVAGFSARSSAYLEISALELWANGVKVSGTLSCAIAPVTGALANLSDADLGTTAKWLISPGLAFVFDLGSAATVQVPRFGAAGQPEFVASCQLEYSSDGATWLQATVFNQAVYPGAGVLSAATFGSGLDSSVMLQISADGTDGSTVFTDASNYTRTATRYGAVTVSTAQSVYGGSAIRIPASSCLLWDDSSSFLNFGSGDFTVAMWLRLDSIALADFFNNYGSSISTAGIYIQCESNGSLTAYLCSGGSYQTIASPASTLIANTWQHIEISRSGNTVRLFVGGVLKATLAYSLTINTTTAKLRLGAETDTGAYGMSGYVDDLIIVKGACLHTADFTPVQLPTGETGSMTLESPGLNTIATGQTESFSAVTPPDFGTYEHGQAITLNRGEFSGDGQLTGTVKVTPASPVARKVRLHREIDGLLVSETWSDPVTGAYQFTDINPATAYTVLSYDHTQAYRAVVADRITPEPMP